jgi:serine O-acetyltransferase
MSDNVEKAQFTAQETLAYVKKFLLETRGDFLTWTPNEEQTQEVVKKFLESEPDWIPNAIANDPALSSRKPEEAIKEVLTYQGLHAIAWHRVAHEEYEKGNFAEARKISQGVRRLTAGIEIHPGATIGKNFFIDHGSGVVIGETAEIGDNVMLYHRVTLGNDGTHMEGRRHPKIGNNVTIYTGVDILGAATVEDNVVIGAGAKIVGDVTIGDGAKVMPSLVVKKDIEAHGTVVGTDEKGKPRYTDRQEFDLGWGAKLTNGKNRVHPPCP